MNENCGYVSSDLDFRFHELEFYVLDFRVLGLGFEGLRFQGFRVYSLDHSKHPRRTQRLEHVKGYVGSAWANVRVAVYMFNLIIYRYLSGSMIVLILYRGCFFSFTLWLFNIAMENGPSTDDFPIKTMIYRGFSMAMLVYIYDICICSLI